MEEYISENQKIEIDIDYLKNRLFIETDFETAEYKSITNEMENIIRPKYIYQKISAEKIKKINNYEVEVNNIKFQGRLLPYLFRDIIGRSIYSFVVTVGHEIDKWKDCQRDILKNYWIDKTLEYILDKLVDFIFIDIKNNLCEQSYDISEKLKLVMITPGTSCDWGLAEQQNIFKLFVNLKNKIGVDLNEANIIIPGHSLSGIILPLNKNLSSCCLCTNKSCNNRKERYILAE